MKERRTYVKAIRMGWGAGSVYFSTEPGTTPDEYVDEICMTQEHTVMGWIYVFKGGKRRAYRFQHVQCDQCHPLLQDCGSRGIAGAGRLAAHSNVQSAKQLNGQMFKRLNMQTAKRYGKKTFCKTLK